MAAYTEKHVRETSRRSGARNVYEDENRESYLKNKLKHNFAKNKNSTEVKQVRLAAENL